MSRPSLLHSIKVVSSRTGLSPHVIRVWEKRYATIQPARSQGNQRLYSEADVERLQLLKELTHRGHAIRNLAQLSEEQLRGLLSNESNTAARAASGGAGTRGRVDRDGRMLVEAGYECVLNLDAAGLEQVLDEGSVSLGQVALLNQVIAPLVHRIGESWKEGSLKVAHEHLASAVIRTYLAHAARPLAIHAGAPLLVATTPAGQLHEIGAALAAAAATSHGWRVTYLGPSLPAEEIVSAVVQSNARAVALSIVHPTDDPALPTELKRLRRLLPQSVSLLVGGRGAPAYLKPLAAIGAIVTESLSEFTAALDELRQGHN